MNKLSKTTIFILGILCLIVGLGSTILAIYIIPWLFFSIQYEIPTFVLKFHSYVVLHYHLNEYATKLAVIFPFLIGGVGFLLLSRYISGLLSSVHKDDADRYTKVLEQPSVQVDQPIIQKRGISERIHPLIKILLGALLIILLIGLAEYLVTSEPTSLLRK